MIKKIEKIKTEYYKDDDFFNKLLNEMYFKEENLYREVALLNSPLKKNPKIAFRGITFSNTKFLKRTLKARNFYQDDSSLYLGVARVKQFPRFKFGLKRQSETKPFFKNEFEKYIKFMDVYIDMDFNKKNMKFEGFLYSFENLANLLKTFKIKCEIVFSGSRGFKILIYNTMNWKAYKIKKLKLMLISFIHSKKYTWKTLLIDFKKNKLHFDLIGLGFPSKLMKCNFSIAIKPINNKFSIKYVFPFKDYNLPLFLKHLTKEKNFTIFNYDNETLKYINDTTKIRFLCKNISYNSLFIENYKLKGINKFYKYLQSYTKGV